MTALKFNPQKPDVYTYHDIQEFLKDLFEFMKTSYSDFSLRKLSTKAGLSVGLLPRILAKQVTLTQETLNKIATHLPLNKAELVFIEWLRQLSESDTQEERLKAYKHICRHGRYVGKNKKNIEAHNYLNKWYYPVIRELVKWPNFELDPAWIRKALGNKITISEAKEGIKFLVRHGYIKMDDKGRVFVEQKQITCVGGVYKLALSEYNRQVLKLAMDSIYETQSEHRELNLHTFAFPQKNFHKVKTVFAETMEKLRQLGAVESDTDKDSIYQACLLSFPVAENKVEKKR